MTKKKVKLAWITNDAARRASLKKRRLGLLKKVSELTVLCGVDAFCIIYSPDEAEPVVWPSSSSVQQLIMRYRDLPEIERYKKAMNQETYLKERIGKAKDQSKKHQKKNKDMDLSWYMQLVHEGKDLDEFGTDELHFFAWLLLEKSHECRKRLENFQSVPSLPHVPFIPQQVLNMEDIGLAGGVVSGGDGDGNDPYLWDQWVYDTMINTNENPGRRGDMGVPYGFNISGFGSNFGEINMGNFYHGNAVPTLTGEAISSLGHPHGNFYQDGGNGGTGGNLEQPYVGLGGINSGGEVTGSGIPQGAMEGSLVGIAMMGLLNSNLGGGYNDGNAAVPHGNWEGANEGGNFPIMQVSYNNQMGVGNHYGTNLDQVGLPNMSVDGLGNQMVGMPGGNTIGHRNNPHEMDLRLHMGGIDAARNEMVIRQPRGNVLDGHVNAMEVDLNGNDLNGFGNAMEPDHNNNVVEGHRNEMVSGMPDENIVHGPGNDQNDEGNYVNDWNSDVGDCGGSVAGSHDVGFQSGFFGAASDIGLPYDVAKTWPNNPSP